MGDLLPKNKSKQTYRNPRKMIQTQRLVITEAGVVFACLTIHLLQNVI